MMTVKLICLCDVYKIDVFTNIINLFDTIGRQILWRQQTHGLLFNRGYSTIVYHRDHRVLDNSISQVMQMHFKTHGS
jgi:hypothetical protein